MKKVLKDKLKHIPMEPGVYQFFNSEKNIIYIGKAKLLRNRVKSYFGSKKGMSPKTITMLNHIVDFEWIVVENEVQALLTEANLIKNHKPKYNIDLNENDLAAQRGYAKAQSNLRALGGKVTAQNEEKFRQLVSKKLGARRASGQTGRSVQRGETLDMAEFGRYTGRQAFGLSMAREKFKENTENIRRRQVSARRGLFSQVAFNPVPSMAPNPPQLRGTGMTMMNAFVGAAGALAGGMTQDPGAPTTDYSSLGNFDVDYTGGGLGGMDFSSTFDADFGGIGTFSGMDFNVNALPDFSYVPSPTGSYFNY